MVEFEFMGKLIGIERINNEWAKLLFEGEGIPHEVSIHRDCVENNRDILIACKKLPDKYFLTIKGKMYQKGTRWTFSASKLFEIVPNACDMDEDEMQLEINSWFDGAKQMSPTTQAREKGLIK